MVGSFQVGVEVGSLIFDCQDIASDGGEVEEDWDGQDLGGHPGAFLSEVIPEGEQDQTVQGAGSGPGPVAGRIRRLLFGGMPDIFPVSFQHLLRIEWACFAM
jgi:hypothetical protein